MQVQFVNIFYGIFDVRSISERPMRLRADRTKWFLAKHQQPWLPDIDGCGFRNWTKFYSTRYNIGPTAEFNASQIYHFYSLMGLEVIGVGSSWKISAGNMTREVDKILLSASMAPPILVRILRNNFPCCCCLLSRVNHSPDFSVYFPICYMNTWRNQ